MKQSVQTVRPFIICYSVGTGVIVTVPVSGLLCSSVYGGSMQTLHGGEWKDSVETDLTHEAG